MESVPPRGSGWVRASFGLKSEAAHPPATGGGTDSIQVHSNNNRSSIKLGQIETDEHFVVTLACLPKKINRYLFT
jgi:hypothetical protein